PVFFLSPRRPGGEGRVRGADEAISAAAHLTLPSPCDGRLPPKARKGRRGALFFCTAAIALAAFCVARIAAADTIYVSNEKDNTITVVDGVSLAPVKTIPVGERPRGILLSKDQKALYICASDSDHIDVLDLSSGDVVRTLPSGVDPEFFALDPGGKLLYVANENNNLVTVVDVDRGEIVTEIPVGVEPEGMGISPDGKYLVNTSETTSMAHVIDTATRKIVANILVD